MTRKLDFTGVDWWGRPTYRDGSGRLWLDTSLGTGEPDLHRSTSDDFDEGEPDYPIEGDYIFNSRYEENPHRHDYMMLDMLRGKCDYFFGHGNRAENIGIDSIIKEIKKLWQKLPENAKPEWLTWEQILEYEKGAKKT